MLRDNPKDFKDGKDGKDGKDDKDGKDEERFILEGFALRLSSQSR
jgi:hypothetical protein